MLSVLLPLIILAGGALIVLIAEPYLRSADKHRFLPWATTFCCFVGSERVFAAFGAPATLYDFLAVDAVRGYLAIGALATAVLVAVAGVQSTAQRNEQGGEIYPLILLATAGAVVLTLAQTSIAAFIGLELMSLAIYAAIGSKRRLAGNAEALYKYFVQGAVFSAIFLYGAALNYGATGSLSFAAVTLEGREAFSALATVLMVIGLLFKVGAVPFHLSPDAHAGSPIAVTAFMAGVVKVGGFALLATVLAGLVSVNEGSVVRLDALVVAESVSPIVDSLGSVLGLIALLSLLIGNVGALTQTRLRRLMAYSSIAHAGYLLLGLIPLLSGATNLAPFAFYLLAYAVATTGSLALLGHAHGTIRQR